MRRVGNWIVAKVKARWARINEWAGEHPAASWFIHGGVCYLAASAIAWLAQWTLPNVFHAALVALCFAAFLMMFYFIRKELGDWAKHGLAGNLKKVDGGVEKKADGWGDLVGPVYFLVGVLSGWYWS